MTGYLYKFEYSSNTNKYEISVTSSDNIVRVKDDSNLYTMCGSYYILNSIDVLSNTCAYYLTDKSLSDIELERLFKPVIITLLDKERKYLSMLAKAVQG